MEGDTDTVKLPVGDRVMDPLAASERLDVRLADELRVCVTDPLNDLESDTDTVKLRVCDRVMDPLAASERLGVMLVDELRVCDIELLYDLLTDGLPNELLVWEEEPLDDLEMLKETDTLLEIDLVIEGRGVCV